MKLPFDLSLSGFVAAVAAVIALNIALFATIIWAIIALVHHFTK